MAQGPVKKDGVAKILLETPEAFVYESNCDYNSYNLVTNSLLSISLPWAKTKNKQVGGLVTKIFLSFVYSQRTLLQRLIEFNRLL